MQIIVKTTTACNFACEYCSEGDKKPSELSEQIFQKLIDELPQLLEHKQDDCVNILWHGGEPLLWGREKLIACMEYAEQKLKKYHLEFIMQSNGYLIDDAFMEMFQRFHVRVGISLDGYPELHNINRPLKDGTQTFNKVWNNIQRLRDNHLGGSILMVLNTENVDGGKLFKFLEDNEVVCKINPLIPCGRASKREVKKISQGYIALLQYLFEKAVESQKKIVIEPIDSIMDAIISGSTLSECSYNGNCSQSILCLYSDGKIGFCGRDSEKEKYVYGDLQKNSLMDLYNCEIAQKVRVRDSYLKAHNCRNCSVWDLCHGGCTFEALNHWGDMNMPFPYCEERRELLKYLQTHGLDLLKKRLIREKKEQRIRLEEKKRLLKEVTAYEGK